MTGRLTAEGLADAGCSKEMLERFEALRRTGCTQEEAYRAQLRLLHRQRSALLRHLHDVQRKLSCLDDLVWQLREDYGGGKTLQ